MRILILLTTILTTISLSLSAAANEITIAAKPVEKGSIDFGLVPYGGERSQYLTLSNNSSKPLTNITFKINGGFQLKHNCSQTLQANQSCQIKITFWAAREGAYYGNLSIKTSTKDYLYNLSGIGGRDPLNQVPQPPIPVVPRP